MFDFMGSERNELTNRLAASRKDAEEWRDIAFYWRVEHSKLIDKYNALIDEINEKGGQEFLDDAILPGTPQKNSVLSQSQLKSILILVHPDKHGSGSHGKMAEELFKTIQSLIK